MRRGLFITILIGFILFSTASYAYSEYNGAFYCRDCDDCLSAINNVTYNVTYLNATISNHAGTCINNPVNFSNVIFDCQGYMINGTDLSGSSAIYTEGHYGYNNTIRNCIISNFYTGVNISNSDNMTILYNTIYSNYYGIYASAGGNKLDCIIENNTFSPGADPAGGSFQDIYLDSISSITIKNNTFDGSDRAIHLAHRIYNGTIIDNYISAEQNAIVLEESDYNNITDNIMSDNAWGGINLDESSFNIITDNEASGSLGRGGAGIGLSDNSKNNTITGNSFSNNQQGIAMWDSHNNTVADNTIISTWYGVYIRDSSQNSFTNNDISGDPMYYSRGLFMYGGCTPSYYNNYLDDLNEVNGNPVYYYRDEKDVILSPTDPAWVGCYNCSNVTLRDFSVSESGNGIVLVNTSNSNVTEVTIASNAYAFIFTSDAYNNTVSRSLIYDNSYTLLDCGHDNIFLDDNVYMYDTNMPKSGWWYDSFDEMSFKLSNLTYGNTSCSQYIDSSLINTNSSVQPDEKTPFTYVLPEGPHDYYFYCIDRNNTDYFDFSTVLVDFGIRMSLGASCTADEQCISGHCTGGVCSVSKSESYVAPQGMITGATTIPLTLGPLFVPSGGLIMVIDNDTTLDLQGTRADIKDVHVIDPNTLCPVHCNQTPLSSYEISMDIDGSAYVCFDKTDYPDIQSITVYTVEENAWKQVEETLEKDNKVCGRVTSSPYMIAGFSIPATGISALEKIQLANEVIGDDPQARSLLDQANQAYFNCEYDDAYSLADQAMRSSMAIPISETSLLLGGAVAIIFFGAYYFAKHPRLLKKFRKRH